MVFREPREILIFSLRMKSIIVENWERRLFSLDMMNELLKTLNLCRIDFYIGSNLRLDIVTSMIGLEDISFDDALAQANIAAIYDVKAPFLHINQLIKNKRAINRPKDVIDVMELEKINKILYTGKA